MPVGRNSSDACAGTLTKLDAFLYGLPGGLLLAGFLLLCFILFGNAITQHTVKRAQPSASSNTRLNKRNLLGKKNRRGPPPSVELRPIDVNQMALSEDAPDDIKAIAMAGKLARSRENKSSKVG